MHMRRKLQTSRRNGTMRGAIWQTLDATTLMLMRHDCVGDDGIGDGAKAWKLLQEVLECGDADSGDFGGTACSTAARGF